MDAAMKIAILKKMASQLTDVVGEMKSAKPPNVSNDTYLKTIHEAEAQLEALSWAAEECAYWNE